MISKVVVFDLDGTLVACNTFHRFLLYTVLHPFSRAELGERLAVSKFVAMRALRRFEHGEFKRRVLMALRGPIDVERFVDKYVLPALNVACVQRLKAHDEAGDRTILATAAPELYALLIASRVGIGEVIATPHPSMLADWKETLREEKLRALLHRLQGVAIDEVYTDHHDDAPMLKRAGRTILVRPSAKTIDLVRQAGIRIDEVLGDG